MPASYVTENGAAFADRVDADGQVRDTQRQAYLRDHLVQAHRALAERRAIKHSGRWFAQVVRDNGLAG